MGFFFVLKIIPRVLYMLNMHSTIELKFSENFFLGQGQGVQWLKLTISALRRQR